MWSQAIRSGGVVLDVAVAEDPAAFMSRKHEAVRIRVPAARRRIRRSAGPGLHPPPAEKEPNVAPPVVCAAMSSWASAELVCFLLASAPRELSEAEYVVIALALLRKGAHGACRDVVAGKLSPQGKADVFRSAVYQGDLEAARWLFSLPGPRGQSALRLFRASELLVSVLASVDTSGVGWSAFVCQLAAACPGCLRALPRRRAAADGAADALPPLHHACAAGDYAAVAGLLEFCPPPASAAAAHGNALLLALRAARADYRSRVFPGPHPRAGFELEREAQCEAALLGVCALFGENDGGSVFSGTAENPMDVVSLAAAVGHVSVAEKLVEIVAGGGAELRAAAQAWGRRPASELWRVFGLFAAAGCAAGLEKLLALGLVPPARADSSMRFLMDHAVLSDSAATVQVLRAAGLGLSPEAPPEPIAPIVPLLEALSTVPKARSFGTALMVVDAPPVCSAIFDGCLEDAKRHRVPGEPLSAPLVATRPRLEAAAGCGRVDVQPIWAAVVGAAAADEVQLAETGGFSDGHTETAQYVLENGGLDGLSDEDLTCLVSLAHEKARWDIADLLLRSGGEDTSRTEHFLRRIPAGAPPGLHLREGKHPIHFAARRASGGRFGVVLRHTRPEDAGGLVSRRHRRQRGGGRAAAGVARGADVHGTVPARRVGLPRRPRDPHACHGPHARGAVRAGLSRRRSPPSVRCIS
ncbi:hypothetical protein DIPPA_20145 [Diplonema papillatum]|nr:hypothetical protein DIPPA_20145 [Diplonema papillatum]